MRRATDTRAACVLLVASLLVHASSARGDSVTEEDRRWLAGSPSDRVGLGSGYAPFTFLGPDGRPAGIAFSAGPGGITDGPFVLRCHRS